MCIDDKLERRSAVFQLNANQTTFDISIPENRYLVSIELSGYQVAGAPVIAGVPASPAYYVAFENCNFPTEMIATNAGTALSGVNGIPLQLSAAFTNQQYDTPRLMSRRPSMAPGLPTSMRINASVRDETGALATFTWIRIYCNLVYDKSKGQLDYGATFIHRDQMLSGGLI